MLRIPRILANARPAAPRPAPARAFDTGAAVVVRYARRTFAVAASRERPVHARSQAAFDPLAGLTFTALVRAAANPGSTRRPYVVEAFQAGELHAADESGPTVPAGAPAAPAPPAPGAAPRVAPAAPAPSGEERMRQLWDAQDRGGVGDASAEECAALDALREAAGLPPTRPAEPRPPAGGRPAPGGPDGSAGGEAAPAAAASVVPPEHPHDVFDRMGTALAYANTFDAGEIPLARRFAELDAQLDRERARASARAGARAASAAPHPPALDELSLFEDVIALRDALAAEAEAECAPTSPGEIRERAAPPPAAGATSPAQAAPTKAPAVAPPAPPPPAPPPPAATEGPASPPALPGVPVASTGESRTAV